MAQKLMQRTEQRQMDTGKQKPASINAVLNAVLDGEKMRARFDELLGRRSPQFISSIVSLINADAELQATFIENPMSVIQSALQAAILDLPIEPSLGFAYIVAFKKHKKQSDGNFKQVREATLIPGYKGLEQLCMRTGAYSRIPDAVDVREGELVSYDRLTGDYVFNWIDDEEERIKRKIIGYAGYFRLKNGAEKTIYMTKKQIEAHERENRKGEKQGKGWREHPEDMARKTVIRRLIGRYGLMSITYQEGSEEQVKLAERFMRDGADEEIDGLPGQNYIQGDGQEGNDPEELSIVSATGEVIDSSEVGGGA